jgi:hypothetical protein
MHVMRNAKQGVVFCCAALLLSAAGASAADPGRVLRSSVWPGMGQLGDGQTVKGLSIMAGEAVLLSLTIANFSKASAYARETEYLSIQYEIDSTYSARVQTDRAWRETDDAYGRRYGMGIVFGGLAGLWWGLNIVDALFFPPRGEAQASLDRIRDNTEVAISPEHAGVRYTVTF